MSERPCGRSLGAAVLGVLLMLSWSGSGSALGQVNPDDPSEETPSNPAQEIPAAESEPEGASPSEKEPERRIFKRIGPQPMTPEQREEAERLRKVAAKYGTDPTAIVGRMQLTSQYLDLSSGRKRDGIDGARRSPVSERFSAPNGYAVPQDKRSQ